MPESIKITLAVARVTAGRIKTLAEESEKLRNSMLKEMLHVLPEATAKATENILSELLEVSEEFRNVYSRDRFPFVKSVLIAVCGFGAKIAARVYKLESTEFAGNHVAESKQINDFWGLLVTDFGNTVHVRDVDTKIRALVEQHRAQEISIHQFYSRCEGTIADYTMLE